MKKIIGCGYGLNTVWESIVKDFILPSCEIGAREETQPGKLWIDYYNDDERADYYQTDFTDLPELIYGGTFQSDCSESATHKVDQSPLDKYWSIKTSYGHYVDHDVAIQAGIQGPERTGKTLFINGRVRHLNRAKDTDALVKFINDLIFTAPFSALSTHQFTVGQEKTSLLEFIVRSDENHDFEISKHLKHRLAQLVVTKYCNYISQMSEEQVVRLAYLCIAQLPMLKLMLDKSRSWSHGEFFTEMESSINKIAASITVRKTRKSALISYIEPKPVTRAFTMQEIYSSFTKVQNIVRLLTDCSQNSCQFKNTDWRTIQRGTIEDALPIIEAESVLGIIAEEMEIQQLEKEQAILSAKITAPPAIFVKEVLKVNLIYNNMRYRPPCQGPRPYKDHFPV